MTNLRIFYSTIENGIMNTQSRYYPGMSREQVKQDFYTRRLVLGRKYGFDGTKILVPSQKSFPNLKGKTEEQQRKDLEKYYFNTYPDGKYIRISRESIRNYKHVYDEVDNLQLGAVFVSDETNPRKIVLNKENDLYNIDLNADILMMDHKVEGITLAYPVADCPVVFAEDTKQKVVTMTHCGGEYIDRGLAGRLVTSLIEEVDSNPEDIRVIVGPHAQEASYIYDKGTHPTYIRHEENWQNCLRQDQAGCLHINLSKAIIMQLVKHDIKLQNITVSNLDTVTDNQFYSNNAARYNPEKLGRFYTGCVYLNENQEETDSKEPIILKLK